MDFVGKVMSLLFNMLFRLVTAFLPRASIFIFHAYSHHFQWLWRPKSLTIAIVSPSICHEVMGSDAMILVFWMVSFKPTFSLSSFTILERLFSSSLLSAIRMVSSAYPRLLIFHLAILILACASSSPAFLMIYSAYKLNKKSDNIQLWYTPFLIWNQSVGTCLVLFLLDLYTDFSGGG